MCGAVYCGTGTVRPVPIVICHFPNVVFHFRLDQYHLITISSLCLMCVPVVSTLCATHVLRAEPAARLQVAHVFDHVWVTTLPH